MVHSVCQQWLDIFPKSPAHEGPEVRERCRESQTRLRSQERGEFPRCPKVRERSRARSLAVRLLRRDGDHRHLPAFGVYMSLRQPVSLGGCGVQARTRVRPTAFYEHRKLQECKFPIDRARQQLSGLSVVQPPKSESRVILCETQANGVALVLAVPGTRPLRGFLDSSCCFA